MFLTDEIKKTNVRSMWYAQVNENYIVNDRSDIPFSQ